MKLQDLLDVCLVSKDNLNIYIYNKNTKDCTLFKIKENEGMLDYLNRLSAIKDYVVTNFKPVCVASETNHLTGTIGVFSQLVVYVMEE